MAKIKEVKCNEIQNITGWIHPNKWIDKIQNNCDDYHNICSAENNGSPISITFQGFNNNI